MAHRKLVNPVGIVDIPGPLRSYPVMRGGLGHQWKRVAVSDDGTSQIVPGAAHPSLPIHQIVHDIALKERSSRTGPQKTRGKHQAR